LEGDAKVSGLGAVRKKVLAEQIRDLKDVVKLSEKERKVYREHLQRRILDALTRSAMKKGLLEGVGSRAEYWDDAKTLQLLKPKPGNEEVFASVRKNVVVGVLTPAKGAQILREINAENMPAFKGKVAIVARPGLESVSSDVAVGKMSVQEAAERQKAYVKGVQQMMESAQARKPWDATGLPQTPTGKYKGMIEWFARKKPWLVRY
jgi:hypothetical protein